MLEYEVLGHSDFGHGIPEQLQAKCARSFRYSGIALQFKSGHTYVSATLVKLMKERCALLIPAPSSNAYGHEVTLCAGQNLSSLYVIDLESAIAEERG
jgi:hypothetical protein